MDIDAGQARAELQRIVEQNLECAVQLSELLHEERHALEEQDVDSLRAVAANKQLAVQRMEEIEKQRRSLCAAMGVGVDAPGMDELQSLCDPKASVKPMWDKLINIVAECEALNRSNGAISRLRSAQLKSVLEMFNSTDSVNPLYNATGHGISQTEQHAIARI